MSVNGLHGDRVRVTVRDRVSGRVRVRACHPDSSGILLTRRKMSSARLILQCYRVLLATVTGYQVTTVVLVQVLIETNDEVHLKRSKKSF